MPAPPRVVTVTSAAPTGAASVTTAVTLSDVELTYFTDSAVIPDTENDTAALLVKPVPVTVKVRVPC